MEPQIFIIACISLIIMSSQGQLMMDWLVSVSFCMYMLV